MKIQDLTLDERLDLVEDLWDSIAAEEGALPATEAQRRELDRRFDVYKLDSNLGRHAVGAIQRIRSQL